MHTLTLRSRVWVCTGKGTGQIFLPQGYPGHSLRWLRRSKGSQAA
jgi:hypothetical protein